MKRKEAENQIKDFLESKPDRLIDTTVNTTGIELKIFVPEDKEAIKLLLSTAKKYEEVVGELKEEIELLKRCKVSVTREIKLELTKWLLTLLTKEEK